MSLKGIVAERREAARDFVTEDDKSRKAHVQGEHPSVQVG